MLRSRTAPWNGIEQIVVVEAEAGGVRSIGYSYADISTALLIKDRLAEIVRDRDAMDVSGAWAAMIAAIRNLGRPGISSMAIAAVDSSLWDLKARLLDLPLAKLLGMVRSGVPVYGSGGFTSYSIDQLQAELSGWVSRGISAVKMKIGRDPSNDLERVRAAREAIGPTGARRVCHGIRSRCLRSFNRRLPRKLSYGRRITGGAKSLWEAPR